MYTAKNYDRLLGIKGFSDKLLKAHFKLYEGYVDHINKMIDFPERSGQGDPGHMTKSKKVRLGVQRNEAARGLFREHGQA